MKIFVDANVVIDYLTNRMPFADDAEAVIDFCVRDGNEGAMTGLSACNAVYVIGKAAGRRTAEMLVKEVSSFLKLLPVRPVDIIANLAVGHPDFEDALQVSAAQAWDADVIVTRDKTGFANSPIRVLTPAEFLDDFINEQQGDNGNEHKN